jgi:hypothetical protein
MNKVNRFMHLAAACVFTGLTMFAAYRGGTPENNRWKTFSILTLIAAALAWFLFFRSLRREIENRESPGDSENPAAFPEGQAKLIDSGRLPNRYNPRIDLKEYEVCHFSVPAERMIFSPLPDGLKIDPTQLSVRYSGGHFYFIIRPQEVLLPAQADNQISGEFAITNQRILFLSSESGFEVPLQSLKALDCSAHLIDFQVRDRRYTLLTEAACYAEKVLLLLQRPTAM